MKGDNVCDEVLNTPQCQFDGGDCDGVSTEPTGPTTSTSSVVKFQNCSTQDWIIEMWYDDGVCDAVLNNPECGYDGSDCEVASTTVANWFLNCNPPIWTFSLYLSYGDNVCDEVLNTPGCQFDGGDCDGVSTEPTGPTTSPSSEVIPLGCIIPPGTPINYLGDDYCDDMLNTEACEFDMGDCSGIQSTAPPIIASTTPTTIPEGCIIPDGVPPSWLGKCSKICFCLFNPIFSLGGDRSGAV